MTVFHQLVKDFIEAKTPYDFVCCIDSIEVGYCSGFLSSKESEILIELAKRLDVKLYESYCINKAQEEAMKEHVYKVF